MKILTFICIGLLTFTSLKGCALGGSSDSDSNEIRSAFQGLGDEQSDQLRPIEAEKLRFMRQEEKLARDVYLSLYATWKEAAFKENANAEQQHMDLIKKLLNRYGVADPIIDDSIGVFEDKNFDMLFRSMTEAGNKSMVDALKVSAAVEEIDIDELQESVAESKNEDLRQVYVDLLQDSKEHFRTVVRQIESLGITYHAQYMTQQEVDKILNLGKDN